MTVKFHVGYDCEYYPEYRFNFPIDHHLLLQSSIWFDVSYPSIEFAKWLNENIGKDQWKWNNYCRQLTVMDEEHALLIKLTHGGDLG